jgi:hypothetical protein
MELPIVEAPTQNQQLTGSSPLSCWVGGDFTNSAVILDEDFSASRRIGGSPTGNVFVIELHHNGVY